MSDTENDGNPPISSDSDDDSSAERTLEKHWEGCVPIHLTLAPTSISSPTIPPPVHILVPRNSYLHVGLKKVVQRLYPFAPVISTRFQLSGGLLQVSEPIAGSNHDQQDEDANSAGEHETKNHEHITSQKKGKGSSDEGIETSDSAYPPCWFQDFDTEVPLKWHLPISVLFDTRRDRSIPWRIVLHFTNYPAEILPFDSTQQIFQHSLKQALTIATGLTKKTAMQLNKESHERLWQALATADYAMYRRVELPLRPSAAIPLRLVYVDDQLSVRTIQRHVSCENNVTLMKLVDEWLPSSSVGQQGGATTRFVRICGVDVDESMRDITVDQLWRHCRLADQFLYIIVLLL